MKNNRNLRPAVYAIGILLIAGCPATLAGQESVKHRYWDTYRRLTLPVLVGTASLDGVTTARFLSHGHREANPIARPIIGDGGPTTFVVVTCSYIFSDLTISWLLHKSGHHKLERWFTFSLIVAGAGAGTWNVRSWNVHNVKAHH